MKRVPETVEAARSRSVDSEQLLAAIQQVQANFAATSDPRDAHADWLGRLLSLTGSECGCSAEVLFDSEGRPTLRVFAITTFARSSQSRAESVRIGEGGEEFRDLGLAIVGALKTATALIANAPSRQSLGAQQLLRNISVESFFGLPIQRAGKVLGVICLANRPGGFDTQLAASLDPFLSTCAGLIDAQRAARVRTEQARSTQQLAHERAVLERLARMDPLESVLEALVLGHEALFPGTLGSVLLLDEAGRHLLHGAAPNLPEEYSRGIHGVEIGPSVGSCGTAAYRRETVVVMDIANDPLWAQFRDFVLSFSLRACWSTPILSGQGKVLGTFGLYYKEPRAPEQHELIAIESSARIAGLAIERKRAEAELRSYAERLALATKSARMGIFDYDITRDRLMWDEQMLDIYGVRREDFSGKYAAWRERVHPDDVHAAEDGVNDSIEGQRPFEATFRVIRPDGEPRFIEAATIMQRDAS